MFRNIAAALKPGAPFVFDMAGDIIVGPVRPDDRAAWDPLWQGYLTFYKSTLVPEVTDAT